MSLRTCMLACSAAFVASLLSFPSSAQTGPTDLPPPELCTVTELRDDMRSQGTSLLEIPYLPLGAPRHLTVVNRSPVQRIRSLTLYGLDRQADPVACSKFTIEPDLGPLASLTFRLDRLAVPSDAPADVGFHRSPSHLTHWFVSADLPASLALSGTFSSADARMLVHGIPLADFDRDCDPRWSSARCPAFPPPSGIRVDHECSGDPPRPYITFTWDLPVFDVTPAVEGRLSSVPLNGERAILSDFGLDAAEFPSVGEGSFRAASNRILPDGRYVVELAYRDPRDFPQPYTTLSDWAEASPAPFIVACSSE